MRREYGDIANIFTLMDYPEEYPEVDYYDPDELAKRREEKRREEKRREEKRREEKRRRTRSRS